MSSAVPAVLKARGASAGQTGISATWGRQAAPGSRTFSATSEISFIAVVIAYFEGGGPPHFSDLVTLPSPNTHLLRRYLGTKVERSHCPDNIDKEYMGGGGFGGEKKIFTQSIKFL